MSILASLILTAALQPSHASESDDAGYEVIVVADPFARWDHTRWEIGSEVALPYPVPLYAARNHELWITGYGLRGVLACELGEVITRHRREADCVLELAAITLVPWRSKPYAADDVLAETDAALNGLKVRLHVSDDGRVSSLTLVDEPETWRRVSIQYENLRQLVSRALVGFHLQTPDKFVLGEEWTERNSAIFSLPSFRYLGSDVTPDQFDPTGRSYLQDATTGATSGIGGLATGGSSSGGLAGAASLSRPDVVDSVRAPTLSGEAVHPLALLQSPASFGRSTLVHRMDKYKGRYVAQSAGEGAVDIGSEVPVTFQGTMEAVSVFDPRFGVMIERVWTVTMKPTPGSALADGVQGFPFRQTGRLRQLAEGEQPALGASRIVTSNDIARGQLAP